MTLHAPARGRRGLLLVLLVLGACAGSPESLAASPAAHATVAPAPVQLSEPPMWMIVGERRFPVTVTDNEAARAFAALLPLTLDMSDLNRNEKHVKLPVPLPDDAHRPGTIRNGDLMLYGSDTLVVFYLTFDSAYAYTRLGRIDDAPDLADVLGRGDVRVVFTRDEARLR